MKRKTIKITIFFALFCFTSFSHAQNISFGAKGGVNFAGVTGDLGTGFEKSMLTGFHIGGFVDIGLNDQFSIVPELLYSTRGFKSKYSESLDIFGIIFTATADETTKLSYIDIPVMATYKLANGLHFEAGPYIGILMAADIDANATISTTGFPDEVTDTSYSIKDEIASTDFGLALGLGYTLDSGLGFSARYSIGMTELNKESGDEPFKNSVIGLSICYMFGQKK